MAAKPEYQPLSMAEYDDTFEAFCARTTEYNPKMHELAQPALDKYKGRTIDMLSIGCGFGQLENALVKDYGLQLGAYHGVEPSENHRNQLLEHAKAWNLKELEMYPREFDESFTTDKKFDVALFCHSLYYMKDPKAMIQLALTFLNPGGEVWIFMQGATDLINFKFDELATLPKPEMVHMMTHQHVVTILQESNIAHSAEAKPYTLDLTDFMEQKGSKNHVVSFMIQTKFENMTEPHQKEISEFIREKCSQRDGKWFYPRSTGMIRLDATQ